MDTPKVIFDAKKTNGGNAFTGNIIFNNVTLNVGNAMSSNGFTAPIAGHYRFSFSAMGAYEKWGIDTWVYVLINDQWFQGLSIGDSNNGKWSDGNNISHNWIWKMNKGDKLKFVVGSTSYLRAGMWSPVNFNGELVFVET